jgi:type II restriction enzyme
MKFIKDFWNKKNINNSEEALVHFKETILRTNKNADYYNDWKKIVDRVKSMDKKVLKLFNETLIDFNKSKFEKGLTENINAIRAVGLLMMISKDKKLHIIHDNKEYEFDMKKKSYTKEEYKTLFKILDLTNFYYPFKNKLASNIESYLTLVLVGMDTNGRKNRSGKNYEKTTSEILVDFCKKHSFEYVAAANAKKVAAKFNKEDVEKIISTGKKIPDFVFKTKNNIYLVETNYSDGGSKLQETIKGYIDLNKTINTAFSVKFIYVSDGLQWSTKSSHLKQGWNGIDYMVNVSMLKDEILEDIIQEN